MYKPIRVNCHLLSFPTVRTLIPKHRNFLVLFLKQHPKKQACCCFLNFSVRPESPHPPIYSPFTSPRFNLPKTKNKKQKSWAHIKTANAMIIRQASGEACHFSTDMGRGSNLKPGQPELHQTEKCRSTSTQLMFATPQGMTITIYFSTKVRGTVQVCLNTMSTNSPQQQQKPKSITLLVYII